MFRIFSKQSKNLMTERMANEFVSRYVIKMNTEKESSRNFLGYPHITKKKFCSVNSVSNQSLLLLIPLWLLTVLL